MPDGCHLVVAGPVRRRSSRARETTAARGRRLSRSVHSHAAASASRFVAIARRRACTTPFGGPVVPEVYTISARELVVRRLGRVVDLRMDLSTRPTRGVTRPSGSVSDDAARTRSGSLSARMWASSRSPILGFQRDHRGGRRSGRPRRPPPSRWWASPRPATRLALASFREQPGRCPGQVRGTSASACRSAARARRPSVHRPRPASEKEHVSDLRRAFLKPRRPAPGCLNTPGFQNALLGENLGGRRLSTTAPPDSLRTHQAGLVRTRRRAGRVRTGS